VFVSADDLKGIEVNHPAAASADIPIGLPVRGRWLYLIPVLITGIKTITGGSVAADTNPSFIIPRFVGNVFFWGHRNIIIQRVYCF